ncbi:MAG: 5'-nucleotidase C-terminal domain-containing protein [Anaerolineae bacterium]|nr:5'-nucleotidase C-terminal domain-containing protein [Anaerolineae bacterium]
MKKLNYLLLALLLMFALSASSVGAQEGSEGFTLTILHNNDGESQLVNAGSDLEDFGGVARFAALVDQLRAEAVDGSGNTGVVLLSSGDNFLASPELDASMEKGVPFYDSTAISRIGYDAMAIGNHEFDFGPEFLADFIEGVGGTFPFVSANLDFSGEPRLQALVDNGSIVKSVVVDEEGQQIGIVGATTPLLPSISSPRNVSVGTDVAGALQTEIDALQGQGVNKIIVISHLQSVNEDLDLATQLSGVDVMIAGGGDELLADADTLLVPGDEEPFGSYPLTATTAEGTEIPVVTTPGDYKYVGKLVVTFDADGNVTSVGDDSGLVRVAGGANDDAVEPNADIQAQVVEPVTTYVDALASNQIGTSEVALEGRRDPGVRTEETNLGSLLADALLWEANRQAGSFGAAPAQVAMQNGGGIRNNTLIPAGPITELTTFDVAPFSNFVTVVYDISPQQFKDLMENALSAVENAGGPFPQIAGFSLVYDPAAAATTYDEEGNLVATGERVQSITLDDGTAIVQDGAVVEGAPAVAVATIDFLARGGDNYPFGDNSFTTMGVSYQQALSNYIAEGLGGTITAAQYPEGGSGRTTTVGDGEMMAEGEEAMTEGEMAEGEEAMTEGEMAQGGTCDQDYVVQADDWLSKIADKFYGDVLAYDVIFDATNAAAAAGEAYDPIADPNIIEIGQVLCIPNMDGDAMAEPAMEATAEPAMEGTMEATMEPMMEGTMEATMEATMEPTEEPAMEATMEPTVEATEEPMMEGTAEPTMEPTVEPTTEP